MKYPSACLVILLILGIEACSLRPEYVRPATVASSAKPVSWGTAATSHLERCWWRGFGSDALVAMQQDAIRQNHDFAARGWVLAQAVSQARVSRAPLLPWLGAGAGGSRTGLHLEPNKDFSMTDSVYGGFQASYELDVWGKNRSKAESSAFAAKATQHDWQARGLSLESDVALAYFYLLAQQERLAVQRDVLKAARLILGYVESRAKSGASAPLDLSRQRGDVATMEARVKELERLLRAAQNSLAGLLGRATLTDSLLADMRKDSMSRLQVPVVPVGLASELLARRPDILRAEASLQAANANIGAARAAFLPSISLTANGGWQSASLSSLFLPESTLYSMASAFVSPIFHGGQIAAQLDNAIANKEELVARYQQTVLRSFLEVDTAIAAIASLAEEEAKRREAADQASEAYKIVRIQNETGAEEFLAALDAQRTMLERRDAVVQVSLARLNAVVSLFKALGGGWGGK